MKIRQIALGLLLAGLLLGTTGCDKALEEGLRDGLVTGVSGALTSIIQVPVDHALDEQFNGEE